MDWPTEEALVRQRLTALQGAGPLDFNLMDKTLTITHSLQTTDAIDKTLAAIGMAAQRMVAPAMPGRRVARSTSRTDCRTEAALIRQKLSGLAGVKGLDFNLMQRMLEVSHELTSAATISETLGQIGMKAPGFSRRTSRSLSGSSRFSS